MQRKAVLNMTPLDNAAAIFSNGSSSSVGSADIEGVSVTSANGTMGGLFDSAYGSYHHDQTPPSHFARNRQLLMFLLSQTKTLLDGLVHPASAQNVVIMYPTSSFLQPTILLLHSFLRNPASTNMTNSITSSVNGHAYQNRGSHKLQDALPDDTSLAPQLLQKINDSISHIENLEIRIADTHSRVLVTGDVNAGKSTFVNTLLRRQIVPDDQEPCTALFVEVMDPQQNGGIEEFHAIKENVEYRVSDRSTYSRFDLSDLRTVVENNEPEFSMLKVYCMDNRNSSTSLLHNGIVDISFIDSPGLNIDSMKTTSLFAKQEEIDVIVFVVRAENHFTQSSCDFLTTACKEKASVFIVVNRFDQIRRKDRCRREILEQIQGISQRTFADADNLVHFVSARLVLEADLKLGTPNPEANASFKHLEESLRLFILEKRSRSKLGPAKVYLGHILSDVAMITKYNVSLSLDRIRKLSVEIQESAPVLERMVSLKDHVIASVDKTIEKTCVLIESHAMVELGDFIAEIEPFSDGVQWDGIMHAWHYAHNLRQVVFRLATIRIRRCQDFAREHSISCITNIEHQAAEAMPIPPEISTSAIYAAFEQNQLAESSPEDVGIQMADLFDVSDKLDVIKDYIPGFALVAGGLLGYRGFASGLIRGIQSAGALRMTKLAFTGVGLAGVGILLYALSDMKSSIQRKVTRKMRDHFAHSGFVEKTTSLLFRTARRALQSTMWEFQNQFQRVLAESEERVTDQNLEKKAAQDAHDFFEGAEKRAALLQNQLDEIDLEV
ncbi:hypothetical protein BSLG_006693 [Batrachochytrium salamandrivorans]|nr:hypothetical protein BSLG_006693 [Batrachochytrium salamandrivorans]